jgi:prevent-host-death family protein
MRPNTMLQRLAAGDSGDGAMHKSIWQLQEAKARFSEVVTRALQEGPQTVTRRGREAVVIVAADSFRRSRSTRRPREFFRKGPFLDGVVVARNRSGSRGVDLCGS